MNVTFVEFINLILLLNLSNVYLTRVLVNINFTCVLILVGSSYTSIKMYLFFSQNFHYSYIHVLFLPIQFKTAEIIEVTITINE